MLKFSDANSKIKKLSEVDELKKYLKNKRKIYSFDILSGHSCPGASLCKSMVYDGKIKDGPQTKFRCFSASQEALFKHVFNRRNSNFQQIKKSRNPQKLLESWLPYDLGICRIHVAGDFFNEKYFLAWCGIARNNPDKLFYAYTKSLHIWVRNSHLVPDNLILTASRGGKYDSLINEYKLRQSIVVFSEEDAQYEIDYDDSHAARPSLRDRSFCLLLHGMQPKGSEAAKALQKLKRK